MGSVIEFPDVSFYQGVINWVVMSSKTKNIIIRSSQGNWADSKFRDNYLNAKAHGMKRGIYHFADDRYHPDVQVQTIKNLIQGDLPETRVWIDWENLSYHDGGNYKGIHNVVLIMKGIEKAFPGIIVGLYTAYYWFNDHTDPEADAADFEYLKTHPLWLAAYTADGSSGSLLVPAPWTYPPELHQWGTPTLGPDYGVQSEEIDMNRVLKNHAVYDSTVTPEPPNPPTGETMLGKVIVSVLNIRKEANSNNTTNPPIGTLKLNDQIEASLEVNGWWLLKKITREGIGIALPTTVCYAYEGASNGYIQPLPDPEPPTQPPGAPKSALIEDEAGKLWRATNFTEWTP